MIVNIGALTIYTLCTQAMKHACAAVADKASEGLGSLAQACCLSGGEKELLSLEMEPVLQQICSNAAEWRRDSHHLYIFDTLIRRGGEALGAHLVLCIPVFALAADHQRDADVRSTLLLLLDDLVRLSCPPSVHSNHVAPRSARRTHSPRRRFAPGGLLSPHQRCPMRARLFSG